MVNFSEVIREERIKQGLSQRGLGKKAGCSGRIIGYWESGEKIPNIQLADKVLKALGIALTLGAAD